MRGRKQQAELRQHYRTAPSCGNEACAPSSFRRSQSVTDAADRMNQFCGSVLVNLLAQSIDVDFDEVRLAIKVPIPNMFNDLAPRDKLRSAKQEEFEKSELLGSQGNDFLASGGAAAVAFQLKIRVPKFGIAAVEASPNQCPHTRKEFRQDEGFGEIVVRARVQAL